MRTILHHSTWQLSERDLPREAHTPRDASNYWNGVIEGRLAAGDAPGLSDLLGAPREIRGPLLNAMRGGLPDDFIELLLNARPADANEVAARFRESKARGTREKELLFDRIRAERFSALPSRRTCLFGFGAHFDPAEYARRMQFTLDERAVYEIGIGDGAATHRADSRLLDCDIQPESEQALHAERYWRGAEDDGFHVEILIDGPYRILRRVA